MPEIEIILGLLLAVCVLVTLARRVGVPYPILLVLGGLALGFVPGLPDIEFKPELVLLVFLPPLLYADSWTTSWRDFQASLRPILLLAVGLVLLTTGLVAVVAHALVPGLTWAAAFVLGAVVAPTDAVAASAIASRLAVPRRILTIVMGESLVNDATALVVYRLAIAAVLTGAFSPGAAIFQFFTASGGGILIGLALGFLARPLTRRLEDAPVEITLSLLIPFAAYLPAEQLHVSGVLAVVTCGLVLGRDSSRSLSARTRLQALAVWQMLTFLLNSLLFILVGLQLRSIVAHLDGYAPAGLVKDALWVSLTVIAARLAWVFPATYLPRLLSPALRARDPSPPWQSILVIAWTGIRGGISLAAALAIPLSAGNAPFPQRDLVIFLTFGVILTTLILQGLTLPPLIRKLKIQSDGGQAREEARARLTAAQTAVARLEEKCEREGVPDILVKRLREFYGMQVTRFQARMDGDGALAATHDARTLTIHHLKQELIDAERQAILELRDAGEISDEVLRRVEHDLDLEEQRLETSPQTGE